MEAKKAMVIMFVSREYIRDNSKEVRSTDKERSLIQMVEYTKGSGQMGSQLVMASSPGLTATDMKDSIKTATNKAKEHFSSATVRSSEGDGSEA